MNAHGLLEFVADIKEPVERRVGNERRFGVENSNNLRTDDGCEALLTFHTLHRYLRVWLQPMICVA